MSDAGMTAQWTLADETATRALAGQLADLISPEGLQLELHGPLGAGKSSFSRALLQRLGVRERIKSPTYSLVESYPWMHGTAWHLDLYRIADPGELEWLGLEALADPGAIVLVEWPQQGRGMLPAADIRVELDYAGEGRSVTMTALGPRGTAVLNALRPA
ncbi:tRNA (adenosine(37)-N6)-threonylcarbamoyltransferase complex ATPase subunit type 1 TsaE [Frateuria aurantia]